MRKEWTLFLTFLKIGAFTFGGGYAMIALLENEFVERKKWIEKDEFLNMVAIAESTPGPVAINSATYIGYKIAGLVGAAAATVAVCIPSFTVIFCISLFFDRFLSLTWVSRAFRGIVLPSFVIILLIAALLKNLMKYASVNAFLSGVRPCVIAMVLATAISMTISTLLGFTDTHPALAPDIKSILVFAVLWLTHFGYKKIKKTVPSPIIMILFSASLGILIWGA